MINFYRWLQLVVADLANRRQFPNRLYRAEP
jgi:hypothetical protein